MPPHDAIVTLEARPPLEVAVVGVKRDGGWTRAAVLGVALAFLGAVVVLPVLAVFAKALENGVVAYASALAEPDTLAALRLTLVTAAIVVPLNTVFGLAAGWAIGKFDFR